MREFLLYSVAIGVIAGAVWFALSRYDAAVAQCENKGGIYMQSLCLKKDGLL